MRKTNSNDRELTEYHITLIWSLLYEKFGFDKEWRRRFTKFHEEQKGDTDITDSFYRFGNTFIEPVLNAILCRKELHPTFNRLIRYIVRK